MYTIPLKTRGKINFLSIICQFKNEGDSGQHGCKPFVVRPIKKISWRPIFYINENLNVNINVNLNANLTSKNFQFETCKIYSCLIQELKQENLRW